MKEYFKLNPNREMIVTVITLGLMWAMYYADNNLFKDSMVFPFVSLIFVVLGLCTVLPLFWVFRVTGEGLRGLGITTEKLALSIIFSIILGVWRFIGIREYLSSPDLITTVLFNAFSIWEVMFIYGWLFTRYKRAFGKIPAVVLTAASVGIYHIGTLSIHNILLLCLSVIVCGIFYMISGNIFTLWPLYWAIGCSASTLKSGMHFPVEMVYLSMVTLLIQLFIIIGFSIKNRPSAKSGLS